jgi:hypothetical protein
MYPMHGMTLRIKQMRLGKKLKMQQRDVKQNGTRKPIKISVI